MDNTTVLDKKANRIRRVSELFSELHHVSIHESMSDIIYKDIVRRIFYRDLKQGQRITESQIIKEFHVMNRVLLFQELNFLHDSFSRISAEPVAENTMTVYALIRTSPTAEKGDVFPRINGRHGLAAPVSRKINKVIRRERE